jgi:type IV pilus assembly protein PilC
MRYKYQAKAIDGKTVVGEVEASSEEDAKNKVRSQQLVPLRLIVSAKANTAGLNEKQLSILESMFGKRASAKEIQIFTRQFATLINAGITVVDSLKILGGGATPPVIKEAVLKIRASIENGKGLGDAMFSHPMVFDRLYCNMVRAGEASGSLEGILNRLSLYLEKSEKIKSQIKGAMFYPVAIIVVATIVIAGILVFIIPKFQELFASAKQEPPALTQFVVNLSHGLANHWFIILLTLIAAPFLLMSYYKTTEGRKTFDQIFIRTPGVGVLVLKSSIAKLTRTLGSLIGSGIPLIEAIDVSAKTCGNYVIEKLLMSSKESVIQGKTFSTPLGREKLIPEMVVQMISIGEQTGSLENMLGKVADFYEDEVDNTVKGLTSMIEPILMVVLGGIIAVLVVAMYLPIFGMAGTAGG